MTDGLDQALVNAGLDRLNADAGLAVYDGRVPDEAVPPYALVYSSVEWPADLPDHALTNASTQARVRWIVHCVGSDGIGSRAVAQRVRTQWLNFRPVVSGLSCGLVKNVESNPPTRDESTGRLVIDLVTTYELTARI